MSKEDRLIARFPPEKGPTIKAIVRRFNRLFHHTKWRRDGNLVELTGDICGPDTDDEGSRNRFLYDADEMRLQMENVGASVELHIAEFAR